MYEQHKDYAPLRELVDEAILDLRRNQHPDFSTQGFKIDDIVEEDKLHNFNASVVAEVATLYGFDINVCRYGSVCGTHETPKMRANGVWLGMSSALEDKFAPGGEHVHIEDPTMCPECHQAYIGEAKKTKKLGAAGIHRFSAGSYLIESAMIPE